MGNVEMHDLAPIREDERRELDLSTHMEYEGYCKHINGEYSFRCLKELPWAIRDSISLHERINISFNCLISLPEELPFRLPHLTFIDLSYNQIASLPTNFGLLFHLQELLICHNCLTEIPPTFLQLMKLEKIDFSYNQLEELPDALGEMESLKKLNVNHNKLKSLPKSLGSSKTLEVLLANSNCCETQPPQLVCDQGSEATLKFLRKCVREQNSSTGDGDVIIFPRVRGNVVQSSVSNPHSARAQYVQIQTETMNTASRIRTPLLPPLGATKFHSDELKDHLIGLIYGAIIGDTLGTATEFLSPDECRFYYDENNLHFENMIRDEHRVRYKRGEWTSNSDQALLVLDSLLQWAGVVDELEFSKRLATWKKIGLPDLVGKPRSYIYSNTINLVLQEENYAQNPHHVAQHVYRQAILRSSNGLSKHEAFDCLSLADSGALPQAIILGIPHFHDLDEVISNSVRICLSTHFDERCLCSCVALSVTVALILQGNHDLENLQSLNELLQQAEDLSIHYISNKIYQEEFRKLCHLDSFENIALSDKGQLYHTFKPIAAAFVSLRMQKDFQQTISSLLMHGGYSSMNGFISGALLGCKFGFSKLSKNWIDSMIFKNKECLNSKINSLLDMMGLP